MTSPRLRVLNEANVWRSYRPRSQRLVPRRASRRLRRGARSLATRASDSLVEIKRSRASSCPPGPRSARASSRSARRGSPRTDQLSEAVGLEVRTPARKFAGCIKTRDLAPLDKKTEFKHYCPGTGLVREDLSGRRLELARYR